MTDVASTLASSLGISSGINTTQLVSDLTSASYQPKLDLVNGRISTNNSRISALASAKSSLQTFNDALTTLLQSSDYSGKPASSDPTIGSVALVPGAGTPKGLPAQMEVKQLALGQVLQSTGVSASTALAGTGTLNLTVGSVTKTITLGATNNTLDDLATQINGAGAGVTASVVTDQSGARLVLKGPTGAANAFTLTAGTADADLQRFTSASMTNKQVAQNAKVSIDNVDMEFDTNVTTTAIPNLRIEFNKAVPGTKITLATDQPTTTMVDLVSQIVDAYNSLKSALNTATRSGDGSTTSSGLLANDGGVRSMSNSLSQLVSTQLSSDGAYQSLASIGVKTENTGLLTLDKTKLQAALAADPAAVVSMLNPTTPDSTHIGIAGALKKITDYVNGDGGPLAASQATYNKQQTDFQAQLDKLNTDKTNYSDQLTKTYTAMQSRLLAFKATQSYLTQQIAAWSNSNG